MSLNSLINRRRFLQWAGKGVATVSVVGAIFEIVERESSATATAAEDSTFARPLTLYFVLGHVKNLKGATISVGGRSYPVDVLSAAKRDKLASDHRLLHRMNPALLTHVANGIDAAGILLQQCPIQDHAGTKYLGSQLLVAPAVQMQAERAAAYLDQYNRMVAEDAAFARLAARAATDPRASDRMQAELERNPPARISEATASKRIWRRLGFAAGDGPKTFAELAVVQQISDVAVQSATALIMKHPEIMQLDPAAAVDTINVIQRSDPTDPNSGEPDTFMELAESIDVLLRTKGAIGTLKPWMDPTDATQQETIPGYEAPIPAKYMQLDTAALKVPLYGALQTAIGAIKDAPELKDKSWLQFDSELPVPTERKSSARRPGLLGATTPNFVLSGDGTRGASWGIKVEKREVADNNTVALRIYNDFSRWLMVFVQYLDANGKLIHVEPYPDVINRERGSDWWTYVFDDTDKYGDTNGTYCYSVLTPVATIFGVPLLGDNYTDFTVTFPENARSVRVINGGLGFQSGTVDWQSLYPGLDRETLAMDSNCWFAVTATFVTNLLFPGYFLVTGVREGVQYRKAMQEWWAQARTEVGSFYDLRAVIRGLAASASSLSLVALILGAEAARGEHKRLNSSQVILHVLSEGAYLLFQLLRAKILRKLWEMLVPLISASVAADSVPFIGEALAVLSVIENMAQLTTTAVEVGVAASHAVTTLTPSYDAKVTINKDPRDATMPRGAVQYVLSYQLEGTPQPTEVPAVSMDPSNPVSTLAPFTVSGVPVGGRIRWTVTMTNADGWQVGHGVTEWLHNGDWSKLPDVVQITIQETPVPLTGKSTLQRVWTTAADASGGFIFAKPARVPGTLADLDTSCTVAQAICGHETLTVGTVLGVAGYVWQGDGGGYYVRNLSTVDDPGKALNHAGPYDARPLLAYDAQAREAVGLNVLLEPKTPEGYVVRHALAAKGTKMVNDGASAFGVVPFNLDDVAIHPSGFLVGVNQKASRLAILKLTRQYDLANVDVSELPVAGTFGGPGDSRPGRMAAPSLVTCTALGTIVVLDVGANNLQAFGVDGTPGNQFADAAGAKHASATAPLVTTKDATTYLSLSSDGAGFLYVLSYQDAGTTSSYQVDIYDVDGGHLNTAKGVNVAAFAVDYWRNPFTLNFQPVLGPDGKPAVLADFHTQEPSLSGWTVRTPM